MHDNIENLNAYKIGFWSSVMFATAGVGYAIGMAVLLISFPIPQWNPTSALYSINLLGWTLFLGLSSFFLSNIFSNEKRGKVIRWLFILNGIICVLGTLAVIFEIMIYLAVYPLLMTFLITTATVLIGNIFRSKYRV